DALRRVPVRGRPEHDPRRDPARQRRERQRPARRRGAAGMTSGRMHYYLVNNEPMFKSVGHALSVAFAMAATKPSVESTTEAVIKDMRERRYGADPIADAATSVNASGLRPNEFRAQCGLIIDCVDATLPAHERD